MDPRLSPFPPMSLQTLSQPAAPPPRVAVPPKPRRRAPELRYLPLELLTAAASHRTGVGHYLDHQESSAAAGGLQRADRHAHSAPATSLPPLGAVEQAVRGATERGRRNRRRQIRELARERVLRPARVQAVERALLTQTNPRQGEGGHSEGELDRILQQQLARLRSSWYCSW